MGTNFGYSMNSRDKGARGEREAAKYLTDLLGVPFVRGQQRSGRDENDVTPDRDIGISFEVKRVEKLNLYNAVDQSKRDAKGRVPVVLHRKNNKNWLLTLEADEFWKLVDKAIELRKT
jgi:Holliday junction resolvase